MARHNEFQPEVVRACAGAGKTFELSSRFIKLLAAGESADRILATTFTRKAAAEIQQRVFLRLAQAAQSREAAAQLAKEIHSGKFEAQDAKVLLKTVVAQQHRLNILTLDSFFIRMARCFTHEVGLAPGWNLEQGRRLVELIQRSILSVCAQTERKKFIELLRLVHKGAVRRSVHHRLAEEFWTLRALYLDSQQAAWNWIQPPPRLESETIHELCENLRGVPLPQTKSGTDKNWEKALVHTLEVIQLDNWDKFLESGFAAKVLNNEDSYYKKPISAELLKPMRILISHARAVILERLSRQNEATYQLAELFSKEFDRLAARGRMLGFEDVKRHLTHAAISDDLESLYYRLDCRLAHLLLDEFQDTSRAEWCVLEPFVDEILSKAGEEHAFFCVGDTKQAIYGWRGGVAEIFDHLEDSWPQLVCSSREISRRSSPAVIEALNSVFGNLGAHPCLSEFSEAAAQWQKRFASHKALDEGKIGYAALLEVAQDEDAERGEAVYERVADLVQEIGATHPELTIGILVRQNTVVARLVDVLRGERYKIAVSEEGGSPLTDSLAVGILLSLLSMADHPGDTVARFHLATSALGHALGFTDHRDEQASIVLSRTVRDNVQRNGLGRELSRLVNLLKPSCNAKECRRLAQLIELGFSFEGESRLRLREFVEFVDSEAVQHPGAAKVRVMTVHQAKGLEFDVVLLPELDVKFVGHAPALISFRENTLRPPQRVSRGVPDYVRMLSPELQQMHAQVVAERVKESLSILYVAMTRAKHALYMLTSSRAQAGDTYAALLREALGAVQKPDEKGELLWSSGEKEWIANLPHSVRTQSYGSLPPKAPAAPKEGVLLKPGGERYVHQRPSELGGVVKLGSLFAEGRRAALERGRILHRFLEQVCFSEDSIPTADTLRKVELPDLGRIAEELHQELIHTILKVLSRPEVRQALSKTQYSHLGVEELLVLREHPFVLRRNREIFSGVFDRVVLCSKGGRVVYADVIDFKTDKVETESAMRERFHSYRPQLSLYRDAVCSISALPLSQVRVRALFVESGAIYAMD